MYNCKYVSTNNLHWPSSILTRQEHVLETRDLWDFLTRTGSVTQRRGSRTNEPQIDVDRRFISKGPWSQTLLEWPWNPRKFGNRYCLSSTMTFREHCIDSPRTNPPEKINKNFFHLYSGKNTKSTRLPCRKRHLSLLWGQWMLSSLSDLTWLTSLSNTQCPVWPHLRGMTSLWSHCLPTQLWAVEQSKDPPRVTYEYFSFPPSQLPPSLPPSFRRPRLGSPSSTVRVDLIKSGRFLLDLPRKVFFLFRKGFHWVKSHKPPNVWSVLNTGTDRQSDPYYLLGHLTHRGPETTTSDTTYPTSEKSPFQTPPTTRSLPTTLTHHLQRLRPGSLSSLPPLLLPSFLSPFLLFSPPL